MLILNLIAAYFFAFDKAKIAWTLFAISFVSVFFTESYLLNFLAYFASMFAFCVLFVMAKSVKRS